MLAKNSGTLELWNFARKAIFNLLAWNPELGTLLLGKPMYFPNVDPGLWNPATLKLWNFLRKANFKLLAWNPELGTWQRNQVVKKKNQASKNSGI